MFNGNLRVVIVNNPLILTVYFGRIKNFLSTYRAEIKFATDAFCVQVLRRFDVTKGRVTFVIDDYDVDEEIERQKRNLSVGRTSIKR